MRQNLQVSFSRIGTAQRKNAHTQGCQCCGDIAQGRKTEAYATDTAANCAAQAALQMGIAIRGYNIQNMPRGGMGDSLKYTEEGG